MSNVCIKTLDCRIEKIQNASREPGIAINNRQLLGIVVEVMSVISVDPMGFRRHPNIGILPVNED